MGHKVNGTNALPEYGKRADTGASLRVATEIPDGLSHHAHILTTRGDSFRSQRGSKTAAVSGGKKETHADDK